MKQIKLYALALGLVLFAASCNNDAATTDTGTDTSATKDTATNSTYDPNKPTQQNSEF